MAFNIQGTGLVGSGGGGGGGGSTPPADITTGINNSDVTTDVDQLNTKVGATNDAAITSAQDGSTLARLRGLQLTTETVNANVSDIEALVTAGNALLTQIAAATGFKLTVPSQVDASFVAATNTGSITPTVPLGFFPQTFVIQCDKQVNLRIGNSGLNFANLNVERGVLLMPNSPMIIRFVAPLNQAVFFWSNAGAIVAPYTFTITLIQSTEV